MPVKNEYLQDLIKQYEELKNSLNKITEELSEDQFNTKPALESWSVGECIGHLNATWEQYTILIKEAVSNNQNASSNNPDKYKPRFLMKAFTNIMEPPYKFKMKTFSKFISKEQLDTKESINKYNLYIDDFIKMIGNAETINLKKCIIISPVSKSIKFQLGEIFPFLAAHARRHIWQAQNVKQLIS